MLAAAAPAFAQAQKGITGRSDEALKNDAAYDAQYRSRRNDDDAAQKADPWGNVRTPASQPKTAATTATKKAKN